MTTTNSRDDQGAQTTRKARRTRMSPQARRTQLIELGLEMAAQRPLELISIDEIAEVAGVSRALLFHYFESKQDFHVAIARAQGEEILAYTTPDESLGDPIAILRAAMSGFIDYVGAHRDSYVALIRGASSTDPAMRTVVDSTRQKLAQRILDYAPALGVAITPYARMAVLGWLAMVEEVTISWLTEPVITRDELLRMITESLPAIALTAAESPGVHG